MGAGCVQSGCRGVLTFSKEPSPSSCSFSFPSSLTALYSLYRAILSSPILDLLKVVRRANHLERSREQESGILVRLY